MWRSLILLVVFVAGFLWIQYHDAWFGPRRFLVCADDGAPVPHAIVILRHKGAIEADFSTRSFGDGWVRIPRDRIHDDTEVFVTAPARGVVRARIPDDDRIALPDGIPVTLRIDGKFELPQPPRALRLVVEPEGVPRADEAMALAAAVVPQGFRPGQDWIPESLLFVDPVARSVSAFLPQAGRWTVRWEVGLRGPTDEINALWTGHSLGTRIPIEIRQAGETATLEISEDELEAADR